MTPVLSQLRRGRLRRAVAVAGIVVAATGALLVASTTGMKADAALAIAIFGAAACAAAVCPEGAPGDRFRRALLWVGLLAPIAFSVTKTRAQAAAGPSLLDLARGGILFAVLGVVLVTARRRLRPVELGLTTVCLAVYSGVVLLSAMWAKAPSTSLLKGAVLVGSYVAVAWLVRSHDDTPALVDRLADLCFALVLTTAVGAAVNWHHAYGPISIFDPTKRLQGLFPQIAPDILGMLAALSVGFCVAGTGGRLSRRLPVRLGLGALAAAELLLSRSRGALLILLLVCVAAVWVHGRRIAVRTLAAGAFVLALIVVALLTVPSAQRYLSRGQGIESVKSLTGRGVTWSRAVDAWEAHPVIGAGYYTGHRLDPRFQSGPEQLTDIDNTWLEVLVDNGLLGLVPLVGFVVSGLLRLRVRLTELPLRTAVGALLPVLAVTLDSAINPSLEMPSYGLILLGALLLTGDFGPSPSTTVAASSRWRARLGGSRGAAGRGSTRRMLLALGDQAVSSGTNFLLAVLVARAVAPALFGVFSLAFMLYVLLIGLSQAVCSQPLIVRFSGSAGVDLRRATQTSVGVALLLGLVLSAGCCAIGAAVGGGTGGALLALGVSLPGLCAQDAWRFAFVAAGRPGAALVNDLGWAALQLAAVGVLAATHHLTAVSALLAWGAAASACALVGGLQARLWPRPVQVTAWWRSHRDLFLRFATEAVLIRGAVALCFGLVGVLAGLTSVAAVRGAWVLFGPLNLLFLGVPFAAVAESVRLLQRDPHRFGSWIAWITAATVGLSALWGALIVFMPSAIGTRILGGTWRLAAPLLGIVAVHCAVIAATTGFQTGLKALAAASRSLRSEVVSAVCLVGLAAGGAAWKGATGAAYGMLGGGVLGALAWLFQYLLAQRHYLQRLDGSATEQARLTSPTTV